MKTIMRPSKVWINLPLRLKALAIVALPLMILLGAGWLFAGGERRQQESQQEWLQHAAQIRKETRQIVSEVLEAQMGIREFLKDGSLEHTRAFDEAQDDVPLHLSHLKSLIREELGNSSGIATIEPILNRIYSSLGSLIRTGLSAEETKTGFETVNRELEALRRQFDTLRSEDDLALEARQVRAAESRHIQYREIGGIIVVALAAAWMGVMVLTNSIVSRIKRVGENTRRMAQQLPLDPVAGGRDEIGCLEKGVHIAAEMLALREKQLRESEEQFRQMAEHVDDVFFMSSNEDQRLLYVNHAYETTWGLSRESFYANRWQWLEAVHHEDRDRVMQAIAAGELPGKYDVEYRVIRPDGTVRWIRDRGFSIQNEGGQYYRTAVIATDITVRKEAEAEIRLAKVQAEAANHAKSDFLSRMSHELRTPLNAILGFGQLLEMGDLTKGQKSSVSHILSGGRHLLDLINEVLDLSKIEAGRMDLSLEPVKLQTTLGELLTLVQPLADERKVRIVDGIQSKAPLFLMADQQRLKQVFLNLLSNGIKYNREGGEVRVEAWMVGAANDTGAHVIVEVIDNGIGIAAGQLNQMFTPFERLGAEQTRIEGTGLGLALSKRLLGLMGAEISVRSQQGIGTTFAVTFRAAPDPEAPAILPPAEVPELVVPRNDGQTTILYIEDNLSNFELVAMMFAGRDDVRLIEAMQGGIGLELAREIRPDLILCDLHLPDISGKEVMQRLRADDRTSAIPVIIVSADAMPRQAQALRDAGAAEYCTKPFNVRELLGMIDRTLDRAHRANASGHAPALPLDSVGSAELSTTS
jgi:PAS domain S-box-containing protein